MLKDLVIFANQGFCHCIHTRGLSLFRHSISLSFYLSFLWRSRTRNIHKMKWNKHQIIMALFTIIMRERERELYLSFSPIFLRATLCHRRCFCAINDVQHELYQLVSKCFWLLMVVLILSSILPSICNGFLCHDVFPGPFAETPSPFFPDVLHFADFAKPTTEMFPSSASSINFGGSTSFWLPPNHTQYVCLPLQDGTLLDYE